MLTLKAALEEASASIGKVDAQAIITHLLGVDRAYLVANPTRILTETEDARVDMLVAQRSIGHPVAYLLGRREFYSRDFAVGPAVLIPRPETETLVEAALARLVAPGAASAALATGPISILDLGTGSGAIAVTLACERPDAQVTATDESAAALEVARSNAGAHRAELEFIEGAWYAPVAGRRFDMIVANPPYVAGNDPHLAQGDLRFEPAQALTDGSADGLDSIRAIVSGAPGHLNPGGWLLLEHGYDQAQAVSELLSSRGLRDLVCICDLAGIPRVAGGKLDCA
jgi:release factor glutamine methyltransferase